MLLFEKKMPSFPWSVQTNKECCFKQWQYDRNTFFTLHQNYFLLYVLLYKAPYIKGLSYCISDNSRYFCYYWQSGQHRKETTVISKYLFTTLSFRLKCNHVLLKFYLQMYCDISYHCVISDSI